MRSVSLSLSFSLARESSGQEDCFRSRKQGFIHAGLVLYPPCLYSKGNSSRERQQSCQERLLPPRLFVRGEEVFRP